MVILLESLSQPDWKDENSITVSGRAETRISRFRRKYGFHGEPLFGFQKTTDRKMRYTPGGVMGKRPDYATVVYCNLIRRTYKTDPDHYRRNRGQPASVWHIMITGQIT